MWLCRILHAILLLPVLGGDYPATLKELAFLASIVVGLGVGMRVGYKKRHLWRLAWICATAVALACPILWLLLLEGRSAALLLYLCLRVRVRVGHLCWIVVRVWRLN